MPISTANCAACAQPTRDQPHRGLFAAGAGAFRACLWNAARPVAQRAAAGRDHDREAANIAAHNAAFAVTPEQEGTAFVPDRAGLAPDILCIQEERQVGNDNTVKWHGRSLQIPPSPGRAHFVRATVRVHEYPDGSLAVFHGPRWLGRYSGDGTPLQTSRAAACGCGPLRPSPAQAWRRARGLQGRCAPLRGHRWRSLTEHGERREVAAGRLGGIGREARHNIDRSRGRVRQGRQRIDGVDRVDTVAAAPFMK